MGNWKVRFGVAILVLLCGLAIPGAVLAQDSGVLEGTVENGTAGGPEIGTGVAVNLYVMENGLEMQSLVTETDSEGRYRFEGLDTNPGLEYWPEAVYLDVATISAEPYEFGEGQTEITAALTVYETTTDDADIRIGSVHIIAESFGQVLRLSEIYFFGNVGDRAYVGNPGEDGQARTVFVPLPSGAMGVAFEEDTTSERFAQEEDGLWDTEPIPPGAETSLIFFSYHLVVGDDVVPLERSFAYEVTSLNLLLAQPGLTLRSDQLEPGGLEAFQDAQFQLYSARDLGPDLPLVADLIPVATDEATTDSSAGMGEVAGPASSGNQKALGQIGFVLALLAVGGVLAYAVVNKTRPRGRVSAAGRTSDAPARRLLVELADLEDAFETGDVSEAEYTRRRAQIYESLQEM
jgi:hypothetical protein